MDTTREALQYIVGLKDAKMIQINGDTYTDTDVKRIDNVLRASSIHMSTLTSLVDYLKAGVDTMSEKMLLQVVSPTEVHLHSALNCDRKREKLVEVEALLPEFQYGRYINHEGFLIALQSKFAEGPDRSLLLRFAGTVENGTVAQYGDDGVTQKATIKTGIASKGEAVVPNPVKLRPYRTFHEVEQPESEFIFRMQQDGSGGINCAIFEADGGAWKNTAMERIKAYLQSELAELPQFTVIA